MSSYQIVMLRNLIPFVPQLKETFLNWVTLDDSNRDHLKSFVDKNTNMKIKLIMSALEQWDDLQKHGAPGVEFESVVYDNNTLHEVVESSKHLNKIILEMMALVKKTDCLI